MYKKVLVSYDGSESSRRALEEAFGVIDDSAKTEITVLNVIDWHDYNAETFKIASRMSGVLGDPLDMGAIADVGEEAAREATERVRDEIADIVREHENGNVEVPIAIVNGSPHDAITAYAEEEGYDCIVMGHRGLGAVRGMLGSVCYSVLHKTHRPVLIVK